MNISFRLHYTDRMITVPQSDLQPTREGGDTVYRTEVEGARIVWRFTPYCGGALVTLSAEGDGALGISRIDSVAFTTAPLAKDKRLAFLGRTWNAGDALYPHELGVGREYYCNCIGLLDNLGADGPMLAAIDPFVNVCNTKICRAEDNSVTLSAATEYTTDMLEARSLVTERFFLHECLTIDALFDAVRPLIPVSSFAMPKLTGWNTWDYYLDRVTPADITENINALAKMPFTDKLDYIVIDDGWQQGWGQWRENEKFACGLSAVAEEIRAAGFLPGIWMAPVAVGEGSPLFESHPDWFCRNTDGSYLYDTGYYYLDPTHPEVEAFVLDNYRYQYQAGFRLFKMDYISPLLLVKSFHDKSATAYSAVKDMVAKVIAATGEDAVILGCSLPVECGPDVAPSMRIGIDVHNHFSHIYWIAESLVWSAMHNNRITRIDPDFLVVRGAETADEPVFYEGGKRNEFYAPPRHLQSENDRFISRWRYGDQFSAIEAETWANLVAVSGGNIFLSDRMSVLNERGIAIIEKALTLAGDEVRPVYQKEDIRWPSLWRGDKALLVINWEDIPRTLRIGGIDRALASDKPYSLQDGVLTVTLLPHESFGATYQ
ncbi:MAG: alpha-galactosidase [Clostridia bacterium]|nr:alpha-galactosidase [Clostridia bacterium]